MLQIIVFSKVNGLNLAQKTFRWCTTDSIGGTTRWYALAADPENDYLERMFM